MPEPLPVLLLAAGRGARLAHYTNDRPKCLVEVSGATPLDRLLSGLPTTVPELIVVAGYASGPLETRLRTASLPYPVRVIPNPEWESRNNIHSAWLAEKGCRDGFVLVNSDVIAHPTIVRLAFASGSFLLVDPTRPPREEAMKVQAEKGCLRAIAKDLPGATSDGEYIGIMRLEPPAAGAFFDAARERLENGRTDDWYEAAVGDAAQRVPIELRSIGDLPWIEIDDPGDLRRAEREIVPRLAEPASTTDRRG